MATAVSLLEEAALIVSGDRQAAYGPAERSFVHIAEVWTSYLSARPQGLGAPVTARNVAWMMVQLKSIRDAWEPKDDNCRDGAGYSGLAGEMSK